MNLIISRKIRSKYTHIDEYGNLFCYKCKEYKEENTFDIDITKIHRKGRHNRCKKCKSEQYLKRRTQLKGKEDIDMLITRRFLGLVTRSKHKNLAFDVTKQYIKDLWIKQNGKCALSGLDMTYILANGRTLTNMSIDRIDSHIGYTQSNIQLVCMSVNQMKSDLSKEELINLCTKIIEYNENKNN